MKFFLQENELPKAQENLKELFIALDYADTNTQYLILLQIAKISFQLKEEKEAISYIMQAGLIHSSYEIDTILLYIALKNNNLDEAENYLNQALDQNQKKFSVFSFEELDAYINNIDSIDDDTRDAFLSELKGDFNMNIHLYSLAMDINKVTEFQLDEQVTVDNLAFDELINKNPELAEKTIIQMKKESGLDVKYPELNKLSIKNWEEEFQDRQENIKAKEDLLAKNIPLELEDLMNLGKMYLLEDEFEKAAECFGNAKKLFMSKI